MNKYKAITGIFIGIAVLIIIIYDIWAVIKGGEDATISWVIYDTSREWPLIPLGFGIVMGHFFWPQDKGKK